jgi:tape measure domain-containing protein
VASDLEYKVGFDVDLAEIQRLQRALATGGVEAAREFNKALGGEIKKQIVFETRTDASGVKRLVAVEKERLTAADGYLNKLKQIKTLEAGSATSLRQQVNKAKQARDEIARYRTAVGPLGGQIRAVTDRWVEQNAKLQGLQRSLDLANASGFWDRAKTSLNAKGLFSFANGLTEVTTGLQSASIVIGQVLGSFNQLTKALGGLQQFKLAFVAINAGAAGGAEALNESSRIALNLGVSLSTVREGFQQLSPVILKSGGSIEDVSQIVESLSSRFAAFGISGDRARRVTNGVIQAFAKGKLQAEELTQQISEADPAFKVDFAEAVGVSVQALEALVKQGKITSDVLIETLPKLSKSSLLYGKLGVSATDAANSIGQTGTTIDQARAKIESINQLSLEALARAAEPVVKAFLQVSAVVADLNSEFIKSETGQAVIAVFSGLFRTAGVLVQGLGNLTTALITLADPFAKVFNLISKIPTLAEAAAVAITTKLIISLTNLSKSFISTAAANGLFNSALGRTITEVLGFSNITGGLGRGAISSVAGLDKLKKSSATLGRAQEFASGKVAGLSDKLKILEAQRRALTDKGRTRNIFADPQKLSMLNVEITNTSKSLQRYEGAISRIGAKTSAVSTALDVAATAAQVPVPFYAKLGTAIKGAFTGAIPFIKTLVTKLAALNPKVAAVIGSLVVLGAAVKAYGSATAGANIQIEKNKVALERFQEILKSIESDEIEPPKISRFEAGFKQLGFTIANFGDSLKEGYDFGVKVTSSFVEKIKEKISELPPAYSQAALSIADFFGGIGRALNIVGFLTEQVDSSSLSFQEFQRRAREVTKGAVEQTVEIDKLTAAIRRQAQGGDKKKAIEEYEKASEAVKAIRAQVKGLQEEIKRQEKLNVGGKLTKEDGKKLEALKAKLKALLPPLNEAQERFRQLGIEIGAISDDSLKELLRTAAFATGRIKELGEELEKAGLGTKAFKEASVLLAGFELALKEIQDAAKNPIQLLDAIPRTEINKLTELDNALQELSLLRLDLEVDASDVKEAELKVEELRKDLDAIAKLKFNLEFDLLIKTRGLEQSLAESQIKITFEEGPIKEAALAISQITNELATAQQGLQKVIAEQEDAESKGLTSTKLKKELIKEAALVFLDAAKKGEAAIKEAGRKFKDQLDQALSAYKGLVLDRPEFFTPGEISQNAKQIEKDFSAALNKVRADTSDWSWGPKLEGGTYDEILKQKKEFVDTRKQADDLKASIKNLNTVLGVLAVVFAKISGTSFEQLKALGLDVSKIVGDAQDSQKFVTGLGRAAEGAAKAYGEIVGEIEAGGQAMVLTTDAVTGEIVQLTRAEYDAAKGAKALGKSATEAKAAFVASRDGDLTSLFGTPGSSSAVIGEIEANGKKLFLIQDEYTGKIEEVNAAQLKQLGLTSNLAKGYSDLGIQIAKAGNVTGEYLRRQQEQAALVSPESRAISQELQIDENTVQDVREAGLKAGGDWLGAMSEALSRGQILAPAVLSDLSNKVTDYKMSLEVLAIAQDQASQAQDRYNTAVQSGSSDIQGAAGWLNESRAALEAQEYEASRAAEAYNEAGVAAKALGIDLNSVLTVGSIIEDKGPSNLVEIYEAARQKVLEFNGVVEAIDPNAEQLEGDTSNATTNLQEGATASDGISSSLASAATQAENIANAIIGLDGLTVSVNVVGIPGLWTGGPTQAGQAYQVNELGQEGFLSASGSLRPISKPKNALWRAPSSGTVIPAHIWSGLDVPTGGVRTNARPMTAGSGGNGLQRVVRAIQSSLAQPRESGQAMYELTAVQARQSIEIGKLSRAVNKLASKDQSVNVSVRGNDATAYLGALNSRI